jgi:CheY-like chemotaxis protein
VEESKLVSVLVAEDSDDNRFLLAVYCKGTPYNLTFAEDGIQAVEQFRAGSFDLVVMDIQMPNMDGLTATRLIRQWERESGRKRTPILAVTANAMPHDEALSFEAGCNLHLSKPVSKSVFLNALDQFSMQTTRN